MGLPTPSSYRGSVPHYPPVLRFLARPKELLHTCVTPIRKLINEESTVDSQNSRAGEEDVEMSDQPEDSGNPPEKGSDLRAIPLARLYSHRSFIPEVS